VTVRKRKIKGKNTRVELELFRPSLEDLLASTMVILAEGWVLASRIEK